MHEHRNTRVGSYGYREIFNTAGSPKLNEAAARKSARAVFGIEPDADPIQWFRISATNTKQATNAAGKAKTSAEILIYDIIDPWGVSAGDFANALNELDVDEIVVGINSPGGIVFDGIAIMNALKRHPANIITRIDGVAASAASFIAMAGDEIQTSKYAEMMIHEARGYVSGTAEDMKEMLSLLLRHNESIAGVYRDRAGGELKDWLKMMKNETWFTAEEMVERGLADTIIEPADESSAADETESLKNRFDLSVFNFAGRQAAPPPPARNQVRRTATNDQRKAATMGLKEQLAEKYGIDANLDDEAFAAALDAAVATETTDDDTDGTGTDDTGTGTGADDTADQPTPELAAAIATLKKHGVATVDAEALAAWKAQSALGAQAFEAIATENDARKIEDAVRAGKIRPVDVAKWTKNLKLDREAGGKLGLAKALDELDAVFPVTEVGHGMNPDPGASMTASDDLSWFDSAPLSAPSAGQAND